MLDTTFVIDYLRDSPQAVSRFDRFFADGDDVLVNEVVVCEAAMGSRGDPDVPLTVMLEAVEFIQPPADTAILAGRWRRDALARGWTLSVADALIAAAADASGAVVLTRNVRDFSLTPVRVESY